MYKALKFRENRKANPSLQQNSVLLIYLETINSFERRTFYLFRGEIFFPDLTYVPHCCICVDSLIHEIMELLARYFISPIPQHHRAMSGT